MIYREYANTGAWGGIWLAKETAVFRSLGTAGLPTPRVLASVAGSGRAGGDPAAVLLLDAGGSPLDEVFRAVSVRERTVARLASLLA